ncbi:MAG TPA: 16S rRNA (uracil(1498)-N(3))-methyltransferase [Hyphomicrobiaceae bacterium]|jgi:16S rRNA (uracil1498-N3)-methyltransferase|nr:16S rRNA (uracil(1498)-N(3))-methyltransferase [Hyphomicrobiaceae bacterium]
MRRYDFSAHRLFVDGELAPGTTVACRADQANYLRNVLRLGPGDQILIFNGRDGEWRARIAEARKSATTLNAEIQVRAQQPAPDIDYLFAPLKRARLDYMVQKATEMGVARLRPIFTRRTTPDRINGARMRANAIEAAEQCGILRVPDVLEAERLSSALACWDQRRRLIFCDEDSDHPDPLAALGALDPGPLALLIGPEGGFDDAERELITSQAFAVRISLGPRILRADTAAVAALALVNATLGDWR